MTQSQEIGKLAEALSIAQGRMKPALESSSNPFFKSKYADLNSVWQACKTPLVENGLAIIQTMEVQGEKTCLVTTLVHSSGQWIKSFLPIPSVKQDPQSVGSAITYCRRYALAAIVGISTSDDDAECAMQEIRQPVELKKTSLKISKEQVEEIEEKLSACPQIRSGFLDWAGIDRVQDLDASEWKRVIQALNVKMRKEGVAS